MPSNAFAHSPLEVFAKSRDASPQLVIVDLNVPAALAAIEAAKTLGLEVLAFVPHVNADLKQRALAAGADRVVARSNFAQHLHAALEKLATI